MSTSPDEAPHEAALFRTIREWGITRGDNGVIGGVAQGLGDRIGLARVPARIILVVAAIPLTGLVLLAYAASWGLLPDRRGNIIVQNFGRGIPNVGALIGIAVLTLLALGELNSGSGVNVDGVPWSDIAGWGPWSAVAVLIAVVTPLVLVGGIVALVVVLARRSAASTAGDAAATPGGTQTPPTARPDADVAPARAFSTVPPAPPAPPRPPRVPGPGRGFFLITLAWAAVAAATAAWMERHDDLAVDPVIAGGVLFVTGLGVILIAIALAGLRLGFLGFVGIVSLVPMLVIAGNAEALRTAYADHGGVFPIGNDPVPAAAVEPSLASFDPTLAFSDVYSILSFDGLCEPGAREVAASGSVARLDLAAEGAAETGDTSVDITAEVTYVSIAAGANITLSGEPNAVATVVFEDRDFWCDFVNTGRTYFSLSNPEGPTLNLVVHDDQYANTIVIKEITP